MKFLGQFDIPVVLLMLCVSMEVVRLFSRLAQSKFARLRDV